MQINGYILKLKSNNSEINRWAFIPPSINLPNGDNVFGATITWVHPLYQIENLTWTEPDPVPPTQDELYDLYIQQQKLLKAVVLCLNDGTLPIGTNKTNAQLKAIIKAKL